MKVEFSHYSPEARVPHLPTTFTREVPVLPRVGDRIVLHQEGASTTFAVKGVHHVYEDRAAYKSVDYGGDRVSVTLLVVSREQIYAEHTCLLKASGVHVESRS